MDLFKPRKNYKKTLWKTIIQTIKNQIVQHRNRHNLNIELIKTWVIVILHRLKKPY